MLVTESSVPNDSWLLSWSIDGVLKLTRRIGSYSKISKLCNKNNKKKSKQSLTKT